MDLGAPGPGCHHCSTGATPTAGRRAPAHQLCQTQGSLGHQQSRQTHQRVSCDAQLWSGTGTFRAMGSASSAPTGRQSTISEWNGWGNTNKINTVCSTGLTLCVRCFFLLLKVAPAESHSFFQYNCCFLMGWQTMLSVLVSNRCKREALPGGAKPQCNFCRHPHLKTPRVTAWQPHWHFQPSPCFSSLNFSTA